MLPGAEADLGAIGNYVWFDEDGDGDQDAGEAGIPNVHVNLHDAAWLRARGDHLHRRQRRLPLPRPAARQLPRGRGGEHAARQDGAGPGGLFQTYDEDNGTGPFTTPHSTFVSLGSGEEHLTADFGYNWAPPGDTNNPPPDALGAIGDRVWIDEDGDGVQDMGEAGIGGVPVQLWYDSDGDGDIDAIWTVDTGNGRVLPSPTRPATTSSTNCRQGIYEVRVNTPRRPATPRRATPTSSVRPAPRLRPATTRPRRPSSSAPAMCSSTLTSATSRRLPSASATWSSWMPTLMATLIPMAMTATPALRLTTSTASPVSPLL